MLVSYAIYFTELCIAVIVKTNLTLVESYRIIINNNTLDKYVKNSASAKKEVCALYSHGKNLNLLDDKYTIVGGEIV
jgi:hypothetical protein